MAQGSKSEKQTVQSNYLIPLPAMVKAMKVMKAKVVTAMPKSGIAEALASKTGLQKKAVSGMMGELVALATAEVKKTGKFTLPGLCVLKTRVRPARKAGTTTAFGKTIKVKARPAQKIVKAYCVSALKKSI